MMFEIRKNLSISSYLHAFSGILQCITHGSFSSVQDTEVP